MSQAELGRFQRDLDCNPDLARQWATVAPGPEARAEWVRKHGYEVTLEEIEDLTTFDELSDDDLEKVAGGWDGGTGGGG
jgi:predicted ribosomally synthesized peptide with nif11-like leader